MIRLCLIAALLGWATSGWAQDASPADPPAADGLEGDVDDDLIADDAPADAAPADSDEAAQPDDAKPDDAKPDDVKPDEAEPRSAAKAGDAQAEKGAADAAGLEGDVDDDAPSDPKAAQGDDPDDGEDAGDPDAEDGDEEGDDAPAETAAADDDGADEKAGADPLTAFREGRYAEARDGYLARLHKRPDAPGLHYRIAVSAALADDPALAERHAATVERLDPGNPVAVQLAAAARVTRLRATPATVTRDTAAAALRDGRLRSAVRLARQAAAADAVSAADRGALHRIEGHALLALGRADDATRALQSAAAFGAYDAGLWLALGDAARVAGDKQGAAWLYAVAGQAAAPQDPVNRQARARRARLGAVRTR